MALVLVMKVLRRLRHIVLPLVVWFLGSCCLDLNPNPSRLQETDLIVADSAVAAATKPVAPTASAGVQAEMMVGLLLELAK